MIVNIIIIIIFLILFLMMIDILCSNTNDSFLGSLIFNLYNEIKSLIKII